MISKILLISTSRMTLEQLNSEVDENISLKEDDFTNSKKKAKSHYEVYPPLGLFYLSAMVKREIPEVEILLYDLHFESVKASHRGEKVDWFEMCDSQIQAIGPDLIGLSTMFGASFKSSLEALFDFLGIPLLATTLRFFFIWFRCRLGNLSLYSC